MGQTLELCCLTCREHLWVGQRQSPQKPETAYAYWTEDARQNMNRFFQRHVGHDLQLVDDSGFDTLDAYDWINGQGYLEMPHQPPAQQHLGGYDLDGNPIVIDTPTMGGR